MIRQSSQNNVGKMSKGDYVIIHPIYLERLLI
jgi:hypothetical protein